MYQQLNDGENTNVVNISSGEVYCAYHRGFRNGLFVGALLSAGGGILGYVAGLLIYKNII